MSGLVAAVDGGGSKTVAVVVDRDRRERGRASAGSSNYTVAGGERAEAEVRRAIAEATRLAGGELPLRSVWIGLAGIDRPGAREMFLPLLQPFAAEVRLTNDAELCFGALAGGIGVVVIAGTGSFVLGRDAAGTTVRAGGWGHLIGDEGSGYDLGRRSLQAAARAADGRGPATALLDAILRHWDLDQPLSMIGRVYGSTDKAEIAALSSIVLAAARDGDAVARRIVTDAAGELALAAKVVADRLAFADDVPPVALAGGLLTGEARYRENVVRRLRMRSLGQITVVADPALSAARSLVG